MKKWAMPLAAIAAIAVVAVAAGALALSDSGDDNGAQVSRDSGGEEAGGGGSGGDAAGLCLEGAIDCDDTIDTPVDPDGCIDIFPTPPECADLDTPVSSDEPPAGDPGQPATVDPRQGQACTMEYPNKCTATAAAVSDLAARLNLAEDAIKVVTVEGVEWLDACLGVSQPDIACAEVITPGFRILLEADGQKYEYHTDGGSRAVFVE